MTIKNDDLKNEFQLFMNAKEIAPPLELSTQIVESINRDLNPSFSNVFMKVIGIHAVVSLFSLSLCSQFGFQTVPLFDFMQHFMKVVGPTYCMAFCGLIYLGISALALSFYLRPEEIKVIRKHVGLQMASITGLSLGVFLCFGATVLFIPTILWITGALVGGIAAFEMGWWVRSRVRRKFLYGS